MECASLTRCANGARSMTRTSSSYAAACHACPDLFNVSACRLRSRNSRRRSSISAPRLCPAFPRCLSRSVTADPSYVRPRLTAGTTDQERRAHGPARVGDRHQRCVREAVGPRRSADGRQPRGGMPHGRSSASASVHLRSSSRPRT